MKISYRFDASRFIENKSVSTGWSKLWKLLLPHKVRTFIWLFCKNNKPVKVLLRNKKVMTPITCPMCNTDIENMTHSFCECKFAVECWHHSGLAIVPMCGIGPMLAIENDQQ